MKWCICRVACRLTRRRKRSKILTTTCSWIWLEAHKWPPKLDRHDTWMQVCLNLPNFYISEVHQTPPLRSNPCRDYERCMSCVFTRWSRESLVHSQRKIQRKYSVENRKHWDALRLYVSFLWIQLSPITTHWLHIMQGPWSFTRFHIYTNSLSYGILVI